MLLILDACHGDIVVGCVPSSCVCEKALDQWCDKVYLNPSMHWPLHVLLFGGGGGID